MKTNAQYEAEMAWIGRAVSLRDDGRFDYAEWAVIVSLVVDPHIPLDTVAEVNNLTRDEIDRAVAALISPPEGSRPPAMLEVAIDPQGRATYSVLLDAVV